MINQLKYKCLWFLTDLMKVAGPSSRIGALTYVGALAGVLAPVSLSHAADYQWTNVTSSAAFAARDGAGALTLNGKMYLIGGWNPSDKINFPWITNNEVWSSTDGLDWALEKSNTFKSGFDASADWEGRHTAGYAVYNDKLWIVGGDANQWHYQNDVWNSSDGTTWTQVNPGNPVPWGPRVLHHTLTFHDKVWVMGGQTLSSFAPLPSEYNNENRFYNDVWNTADGVNWARVTEHAAWSPRGMIGGSVVFDDKMWIVGGGTYQTPDVPGRLFNNDVWSSVDGENWTQVLSNAPWQPRQYHDVEVFDGRMWVIGGWNWGDLDDVWSSTDGINWEQLPDTPWTARHASSAFVYDDSLWIVGGSAMQTDVWRLSAVPEPASALLLLLGWPVILLRKRTMATAAG